MNEHNAVRAIVFADSTLSDQEKLAAIRNILLAHGSEKDIDAVLDSLSTAKPEKHLGLPGQRQFGLLPGEPDELVVPSGSGSWHDCNCDCHYNPAKQHVYQCCSSCGICGANIAGNMELHMAQCHSALPTPPTNSDLAGEPDSSLENLVNNTGLVTNLAGLDLFVNQMPPDGKPSQPPSSEDSEHPTDYGGYA